MNRRKFLEAATLAGLSLATPLGVPPVRADSKPYGGPYWVLVNASGAWDPTFFFNPTGNAEHNRFYASSQKVGAISCAVYDADPAAFGLDATQGYEAWLMSPLAFLQKHGSRLCVVNGIDTSTNNHDTGRRTIWSGKLTGSYPSIGALIAAARAPDKPIAFLSGGGYDVTGGLVPLARVTSASAMKKVARPNVIDPDDAQSDRYHTDDTANRIAALQAERVQAQMASQHLPKLRAAKSALYLARENDGALDALEIPDQLVDIPGYQLGDLERFLQQAQLAVAAFRSGLAVCANLSIGGFDTHGNHDRDQPEQLCKLFFGIDYLMAEAKAAGIDGDIVLVAASDFGRGPYYNGTGAGAGKDHWPVTSIFAMGPGIAGNRVVGGTDEGDQLPLGVDPGSLDIDEGGVRITPAEVHGALRRLAGIDGSDAAAGFPLGGETMALFGA